MTVVHNVLLSLLFIKLFVFFNHFEYLKVDRNGVLTNINSKMLTDVDLFVPWMSSNLIHCKSILWIWDKNLPNEMLA